MNIIRVTFFALGALVFAASCSKEAAEPSDFDWFDGNIYFRSFLSDVSSSRAEDMTLDALGSFQVTCFNTGDLNKNNSGFISPYFEDATFIRSVSPSAGVVFISSPEEDPRNWPQGGGLLRFFAFSPSRAVMSESLSAIEGLDKSNYLNLINASRENDSKVAVDYRLGSIRVNPDISGQFDFVTAETSGERWKDFSNGVDLAFHHQMAQVELRAWGASSEYNFEIAGVRIGNPVVEGSFVFFNSSNNDSHWDLSENPVKDNVEYLYRPGNDAGSGDRIFFINPGEHSSNASAASIMGRGGCAMVLPTVSQRWEGLADPNIADKPYSTDKMYFSVLMRVYDSTEGNQIYPYLGNPYGMTVIPYAVDQTGLLISRLYKGDDENEYFTDPGLTQPYMIPDGVSIKEFGWAAVPLDANWEPGKRYVYTLDYSEGIGVHNPDDPIPGKPIVDKASISWGVTVDEWDYAVKNDDYDPDIEVP